MPKITYEAHALDCLEELYQIARALLPDARDAERAVEKAYAQYLSPRNSVEEVRLALLTRLMGVIGPQRRRRWSWRLFSAGESSVCPELQVLRSLPTPQAEAWLLADVCEFDLDVIGSILGYSASECRTLLVAGQEALRRSLRGPGTATCAKALAVSL